MTGSATAPPVPLYGSGPWLIVNAHGLASEGASRLAADQCRDHGVDPHCITIDDLEVSSRELIWYLGLVLVLPDGPITPARLSDLLRPYRLLCREYRSRRSVGVREAVLKRKPWYAVGCVQLVGQNALLRAPALRTVRSQACREHVLEVDPTPDLFAVYKELPTPITRTHGDAALEEQRLLDLAVERLRRWGVEATDGPAVLDLINETRNNYEQPNRSAMYRPIAGHQLNRLDLMLDGRPETFATNADWFKAIGDLKAWTENNAAVWREVQTLIRETFPAFRSTGHRGAVEAFQQFYRDLLTIDPYYRHTADVRVSRHDRQILP